MSRTSMALKRLGVASIAVVTLAGVVPAFTAAASANHTVTAVNLTPDAVTAPAGTCNVFTAQLTFANVGDTATVDVQLVPRAGNQDVAFCTVSADGTTSTTTTNANPAGASSTERQEFLTDANGRIQFGAISLGNQTGVVDVTAFVENPQQRTPDNIVQSDERQDTSVLTTSTGGQNAVTTVNATPDAGFAVQGNAYTFQATVTDANSKPVPGVDVSYDVTAGPDAALGTATASVDCNAATNQLGQTTCTLTPVANQGPGTDTIVVFVNQVNADGNILTADTDNVDAGEPRDTISVAFQAPQAAGTTVTVTCTDRRTNSAGDECQNQLTETTETFSAVVRNAAGTPQSGVAVTFALSKSGIVDDAGTTTSGDNETISASSALTDANGVATVTVTNPRPTTGERLTVTATIGTANGTTNSDSASVTFRNPTTAEARIISLTPETQTVQRTSIAAVVATVTDRLGNPVKDVGVTLTENGTGRFTTGSDTFFGFTDAAGQVRAELSTQANEPAGSTTVTASISNPRTDGATNDECEQAANTTLAPNAPVTGTNNAVGTAPAGACTDTATVTFSQTAPSPTGTATPTATTSPSGTPQVPCTTPASVTLERTTITATGSSGVTVRATANSVVDLFAYSRPSTTYRVVRSAEVGADGVAEFRIVPPTNTRLYAQQRGCDASPSVVLNVRTQLSLNVVRNGTRNYTFSGRALPARNGGLIVSLYRVTANGNQILTAQTRANASTGVYSITRQFTGSGRFGFVVRTGQDLQNAPGASNVRSLLVF